MKLSPLLPLCLLVYSTSVAIPTSNLNNLREIRYDFKKIDYSLTKSQEKDYECMKEALWYEARGEGERGLQAVAQVIINRSNSKLYSGDVCKVIHAKKQFSYRNAYKAGKPVKINFKKHEEETYAKVSNIAKQAILGASKSLIKPTTLWYHTKQVRPKWNYSKIEVDTKIGNHVFYSMKGT